MKRLFLIIVIILLATIPASAAALEEPPGEKKFIATVLTIMFIALFAFAAASFADSIGSGMIGGWIKILAVMFCLNIVIFRAWKLYDYIKTIAN